MSRSSLSTSRQNLEFEVSPFDNNGEISEDNIPSHVDDIQNKTEENILTILIVITCSNIWSLILITLPVLFTIGTDNLYYKQKFESYSLLLSSLSSLTHFTSFISITSFLGITSSFSFFFEFSLTLTLQWLVWWR